MDSSKLKVGEVCSETQFYTVKDVKGDIIILTTDSGSDIQLNKKYVDTLLTSGDQFSSQRKVSRTEAINYLMANANKALTVSYQKKVEEKEVVEEIVTSVKSSNIGDIEKAVKAGVKKSVHGVERIMTGRHNGSLDDFGRLNFIDMKITSGVRNRLVDPRTINYIIANDEKVIVK